MALSSDNESPQKMDIAITMVAIFSTMLAVLISLIFAQTRNTKDGMISSFLPDPDKEPSKYHFERYCWVYSPVWIGAMGVIVVFQLYEDFTAWTYDLVLGGLALPFLLQPIIYPLGPDKDRPLLERYAFKANLWIAIFTFIGNYWYTHYFFSVLKARYSMPAHNLNAVPIALYFATHFYFSSYHAFSNAFLRKVQTTYQKNTLRTVLFCAVIAVFSYFTAFMETLTISSYPYYSFEDRDMAFTLGSAFYGIYFLFSFPMFFFFDNSIDDQNEKSMSVWETVVHANGCGMLVLCSLDLVRLFVAKVPLIVGDR